ncbi:PHP domain-containing protein [Stigmatella sp. ncwal1]|uniref:PHP domain-containing protein n=1 Tax=Stigmatella ashevillensis TaxID=2995309 RepID=A0ABT5D5J6_9BACT|nr:PHP domain-containing protein [Stigmatella ashevillena]MDC0708938.1 PHP domain-containing protein [Stigmatella ashevillena]
MKRGVVVGKLLRALVGLVLLGVGYIGFFTFAALFVEYPVVPTHTGIPPWPRGAFHVHTERSDGEGTAKEVAVAAKAAGLQFVVMTDHNDFTLREPVFLEGVLLVPGVEISTRYGHLVALGLRAPLEGDRAKQEGVRAVEVAGGLSVLAHPVQQRNPWKDPEGALRAQGFEQYSADTFFREAVRHPFSRLLPAIGAYLINPVHGVMTLVTPQPETTDKLLELSHDRSKLVLCSHDAHGRPRYEDVFRSLAMYLPPAALPAPLSAEPRVAADQVVQALASGQAICAFRALGEPMGFAVEGPVTARREARVGDVLRVRLPPHPPGRVRVEARGAGRVLQDGNSVELTAEGPVLIEAWVLAPGRFFGSEWKPWIAPGLVRVLPRDAGI